MTSEVTNLHRWMIRENSKTNSSDSGHARKMFRGLFRLYVLHRCFKLEIPTRVQIKIFKDPQAITGQRFFDSIRHQKMLVQSLRIESSLFSFFFSFVVSKD
jgi:hypothetical protein